MEKGGCIYFMSNLHNTVLYVGVTSDLPSRLVQHKSGDNPNSFTAKFNCTKLVYYECFSTIDEAIAKEKNIKDWKREWKNELISKMNPEWKDLSEEVMQW